MNSSQSIQIANKQATRSRGRKTAQTLSASPIYQGKLSSCAQSYAKALTDPFGPTTEAPCIPDTITLPSYKFSTTTRGVFVVGTSGLGYVSYDPWLAVHNGASVAAPFTNAPVRFTQAAFAGASFDAATIPAGTGVAASNSQITVSQMQDNLQTRDFRLVGAGLRVRYASNELDRGGRMIVYRNRANLPLLGATTIASLLRDNFYSTVPVDREWHTITYAPSRAADITYQKYVDPISALLPGYPIFLSLVETKPGLSFEFEAVSHFEMIAGSVGLPITPSHADPAGFGAVTSSMPDRFVNAGLGLFKSVAARAANYLVDQVSQVLPLEGRVVMQAAKALPWDGPRIEEVSDHEEL